MYTKRALLISLFVLALSGLMLHYRIHNFMVADPVTKTLSFDGTKFLSFIFPLIDVIAVTALFMSRKTIAYAYLLNGIIVIYGTVFMAHFSIAELTSRSAPFRDWFLKSTLPDIGIAWADFFTGKALYDLHLRIKHND
ncbi:MAG: hypothetical protein HY755_03980 [Nitrospirae bacterium]|nr:hypothetical protein [Nitrospirota bacterium]MBI4847257.1 hypothetical protein [Nitrospirota bacterium]